MGTNARADISLVFFLVCVTSCSSLGSSSTEAVVELQSRRIVPSIYVFGDSLVDVGNNNFLPPPAPRARPPYGIDFPGTGMTGRFTNGYNLADLVARRLGFMKSPPAYLSLTPLTNHDLLKCRVGAKYASGGSGILNTTALYKLGARRLGILDVPPIGCTPGSRVPMAGGCNEAANSMARNFNKLLRVEVAKAVAVSMPGMKYSIASTYNFLTDLMGNHLMAGIPVVYTACCGSGKWKAEVMCSKPNTTYCLDRNDFMFWDMLHPTQATYERGVVAIFYGPHEYADPINLARLVGGLATYINTTMTPGVSAIY